MTDEADRSPRPALPDEALASQRESLSGKLTAAQATLTQVLADLTGIGGDTAPVSAQLQQIAALQGSVATADSSMLESLRGDIASAVAQSQAVVQEARAQALAVTAAQVLNSTAAASRTAVANAMNALRDIPLTFTSAEDEAEYRRRESEREAYIAAQQDKHTPEGDLNAAGAAVGQMVDAKAHGASGPEFEQRVNDLIATTENLREAARANGISTDEFDRQLRDDLRRILKSKGLSDAEIDAKFAATPDPLEAAKGYLQSDDDLARVRDAAKGVRAEVSTDANSNIATSSIAAEPGLNDTLAKLSAAGLALTDHPASAEFAHGVPAQGQGSSTARTV